MHRTVQTDRKDLGLDAFRAEARLALKVTTLTEPSDKACTRMATHLSPYFAGTAEPNTPVTVEVET